MAKSKLLAYADHVERIFIETGKEYISAGEAQRIFSFRQVRSSWDDVMKIGFSGKATKKVQWAAHFIYIVMKFTVSLKKEMS
jgi:hypothetical protein